MADLPTENVVSLKRVSRDWSNRGQSWTLASVYTVVSDIANDVIERVRVEIRANAYEDQSHAKLSVWSSKDGWLFHTGIPTEQWYSRAPSYVQKQNLTEGGLAWKDEHYAVYDEVESQLLKRYTDTFFPGFTVKHDG